VGIFPLVSADLLFPASGAAALFGAGARQIAAEGPMVRSGLPVGATVIEAAAA
jgi:hypothetical protein